MPKILWRCIFAKSVIRSIGFQVLFLLAVVFAFGVGAVVVLLEPQIILIYGPLLIVIGIPILVLIIKNAGRFNQIVLNTNELVQGKLGSELPAEGKSPLRAQAWVWPSPNPSSIYTAAAWILIWTVTCLR
ncbi:hypothetical protein [Desulfofalx alkaliphila]|uniref:hypothetical protein n=1 Tax=Desulfofalx alkaliphila TaxID=105483 RepID=UPI0030834AAC